MLNGDHNKLGGEKMADESKQQCERKKLNWELKNDDKKRHVKQKRLNGKNRINIGGLGRGNWITS